MLPLAARARARGPAVTRARDALVDAILPCAPAGLSPIDPRHRASFWARFHASAPWTLRFAFTAAAVLVTGVMPWLLGYGRAWARLQPADHDAILARCERLPGLVDLLEVAKLVTCFLVFDDVRAQDALRPPFAGFPVER